MIEIEMEGFDELINDLENIKKKAKKLDGYNEISFENLFPPAFMKKYTAFGSINEMFKVSPFELETQEDFKTIPEDEMDKFINENTEFTSWEDMIGEAGELWLVDQIGL